MRDLKIPAQRHPEKARRPDNAQPKKPSWIRVKAPGGKGYADTARIMRENKLVTVCEEAGCPDRYDPELTKADASKVIDELQTETGRGQ